MNLFDKLTETVSTEPDENGYTGADWKRNSLAVVASGPHGGAVLWTVGPHVRTMLDECGGCFDDIGFEEEIPNGISIWKGKILGGGRSYEGDYNDTYLRGVFRAPTQEEWDCIRRGVCPWDEEAWKAGKL